MDKNSVNRILLIYQGIPEAMGIYLLENLPQDEYLKILSCHGHYQGASDSDLNNEIANNMEWLAVYILNHTQIYSESDENGPTPNPGPIEGNFEIVVTGYLM